MAELRKRIYRALHDAQLAQVRRGGLESMFGFATPQAIYKWQQGITMPTIDNLVVLAAIFRVHIEDILVIDQGLRAA